MCGCERPTRAVLSGGTLARQQAAAAAPSSFTARHCGGHRASRSRLRLSAGTKMKQGLRLSLLRAGGGLCLVVPEGGAPCWVCPGSSQAGAGLYRTQGHADQVALRAERGREAGLRTGSEKSTGRMRAAPFIGRCAATMCSVATLGWERPTRQRGGKRTGPGGRGPALLSWSEHAGRRSLQGEGRRASQGHN